MHATDLILHILHCEKLVKTQLGFLVYLVDREWVQRTGQSLTGFTYRKSRNRPRAEEFDDALRDLEDSNAVTVTKGTISPESITSCTRLCSRPDTQSSLMSTSPSRMS